jgi:hypothetical protein
VLVIITIDAKRASRSMQKAPIEVKGTARENQRDLPIAPESLPENAAVRPIKANRLPMLPTKIAGLTNLNLKESKGKARKAMIGGINIIPMPKMWKNFSLKVESAPVLVNKEIKSKSEKASNAIPSMESIAFFSK